MLTIRWYGLGLFVAAHALLACSSSSGGGGSTDGGSPPDGSVVADGGPVDTGSVGTGSSDSATVDAGVAADASATGDTGTTAEAGTTDAGGSDAPSNEDGGGSAGDAGAASCEGPDGGGLPYTGSLILSRVMMPPAAARFDAIGEFDTTASFPPSGCTGMTMGACCLETTGTSIPTAVTAGTITVSDGTTTLGTLTSPSYTATNATTSSFTWAAGTTLTIASSGATVDAFSTSIVAPGALAGLTPSFSAAITVSLHSDLVVSWTPGTRACAQISFGLSQGSGMPHIGCVVDDSAGTVTVPAALLGMITASSGTAVMERVVGKHIVNGNALVGVGMIDVIQTTTTYTP